MSDTIVVAWIGLAGTVIVAITSIITQVCLNNKNRKKQAAEDAEKEKRRAVEAALAQKELETRLSNIEHKLDIHNGYAEKLGAMEKSMAVIETEIKNIYKDEKK